MAQNRLSTPRHNLISQLASDLASNQYEMSYGVKTLCFREADFCDSFMGGQDSTTADERDEAFQLQQKFLQLPQAVFYHEELVAPITGTQWVSTAYVPLATTAEPEMMPYERRHQFPRSSPAPSVNSENTASREFDDEEPAHRDDLRKRVLGTRRGTPLMRTLSETAPLDEPCSPPAADDDDEYERVTPASREAVLGSRHGSPLPKRLVLPRKLVYSPPPQEFSSSPMRSRDAAPARQRLRTDRRSLSIDVSEIAQRSRVPQSSYLGSDVRTTSDHIGRQVPASRVFRRTTGLRSTRSLPPHTQI